MHRSVHRRRSLGPVAAIIVLGLLAAACGIASSSGTVRVYSGRHYDLEQAFTEFSEAKDVSVEFLFGGDAELRERLGSEGEDTLADVYMTVDAGNLALAASEGLFRPLDSDVLTDAVPEHLRDPEGRWFGLSMRVRTIMYHPDRVDPSELSTYEALADPEWEGRLCMRNSTNVYTQSLVASLIAHHGYAGALEVVEGWVDNDVEIINSDIRILAHLEAGACDVGITNHYYLARLLADDPDFPVRPFWANQDGRGVHVNVSGAGVTRHADDPGAARRLLEWLATDGQGTFVSGNHEYPVNPAVDPHPIIEGFGSFEADTLNAGEYGALNADAVRLMDEAGYE